jgi:PA domain
MKNSSPLRHLLATCTLLAAGLFSGSAFAAAEIVVVNFDPAGSGLNDPTPVTPVGNNPGTTLGEQRQVAYFFAAQLWGSVLNSDAPVFVGASFANLLCTPTGAVLGSAGTTFVFNNFPNAPRADTWYSSALADAIAGEDLNPGFIDINSRFNALIGTDPNCLGGRGWYYGLDHNAPPGDIDFLNVVMHEIGHGLGVQGFESLSTGAPFFGIPSIYSTFMFDNTVGKLWVDMTDAERLASATNTGNVVWNGARVRNDAAMILGPATVVGVNSPASIAGSYEAQAASFGPAITLAGTTGNLLLVDDGVGAGTDACEAIVTDLSGAIALIDRGGCAFTTKVGNAQAAGAIGAIVANNAPGGPAPMGGADPSVTIPSVGVTLDQGNTFKSELGGGVNVSLKLDFSIRAGGDGNGNVRLYMPNPVQGGSSRSHYDTVASPNLLMEPSINTDLRGATDLDLTPAMLEDQGWTTDRSNGTIEGCDTGLPIFQEGGMIIGATVQAHSAVCAVFGKNHGGYTSCMAKAGNSLNARGAITGKDKGRVQSCAANSSNGK